MSSIESSSDRLGVSGHADPDGEVPWALQLVVRAERSAPLHSSDVWVAAAKSVVGLLAAPEAAPGGEWEPAVSRWLAGRIRKLCRRARASAWDRAAVLPGVTATHATATVRAFVPCPVDRVPAEIGRLQVQGLDTDDPEPVTDPARALLGADQGTLVVAVNPAVAQGFPVVVSRPAPADFDRFSAMAEIEIRDAGFTEVAAGSLTVVARRA
jgi:hypothetical protein